MKKAKGRVIRLEGRLSNVDLSKFLSSEPKSLAQISLECGLSRAALHNRLTLLLREGIVKKTAVTTEQTRARDGKPYKISVKENFYHLAEGSGQLNAAAAERYLRPSDYDVLRALIKAGKPSRATEIVGFSRAVGYASEVTYALVRLHAAGFAEFFLRAPNDSGRAVRFWSATKEGLDRDALQPDPFETSRLLHNLFFFETRPLKRA